MGRAFSDITFTPTIREIQTRMGSRAMYAGLDRAPDRQNALGRRETEFIQRADHFYQATVSETGWPYVQHRGGPAGFLKVLDDRTLAFADFRGNVQYLSVGNLKKDGRIAMIFVDYANQMRLKVLGRARTVELDEDPELIGRVRAAGYSGQVERAFIITVEAYDWNCPQHITPRFTEAEIATMLAPLQEQVKRMKAQLLETRAVQHPSDLGTGPVALVVTGVRQLTPNVRAYELRDPDGRELPQVAAGAYLSLPVLMASGVTSTRTYSISSSPYQRDFYEVAILREEGGSGGSASAHEHLQLGTVLHCAVPGNDFALDESPNPALLIAGGIGITPIRAMAHALLAKGRPFTLHYAVRSDREAPFISDLKALLGNRLRVYAADQGQRLDPVALLGAAQTDTVIYVCGPERLSAAVDEAGRAVGVDPERIRMERFKPAADVAGQNRPISVRLEKSRKVIQVRPDQTILDAVQKAGIDAPSSCRTGTCGTCAVTVLEGRAEHRDTALSDRQRADDKMMCPCVSRAMTSSLTLDL